MKYNSLKPCNNLPDLPPRSDLETKVIMKKIITASRALSELKGAIKNLPDSTCLLIPSIYTKFSPARQKLTVIILKPLSTT